MKTVLILTAAFGEGHNAAARNVRDSLAALAPGNRAVIDDPFLNTYGRFNRIAQQAYIATINHAPAVWQAAFHLLDRTRLVEWHMGVYGAAQRRLQALIEELRPSVVVSTYPGCNLLLDRIFRRRLKRPFTTVTVVTDSLTINSVWHRSHSDVFVLANEGTAEVMRRAGVPAGKIRVPGFPVPRIFASLNAPRPVPPADGRWRVLYVINSARHLAPAIARELAGIKDIELTATVGRDEALRGPITAALGGNASAVHGWTPDMPRLMAESHLVISKAGGATVQETLAARTPMIITQVVPGQEEGNARLVIEAGAGAFADTPGRISATVSDAFADNGRLWQRWHSETCALSRPDASDRIAEFLLALNARPVRET